jgi:hypothetical protein
MDSCISICEPNIITVAASVTYHAHKSDARYRKCWNRGDGPHYWAYPPNQWITNHKSIPPIGESDLRFERIGRRR